jgi:hypothetical protein
MVGKISREAQMMKSRGPRLASVEPLTITFRNAKDVAEFDERCERPKHKDGKKSLDADLWIVGRYLRALAAARYLMYPLTATRAKQSESPDFMLSMPGGVQIGLEMTEAGTSETHRLFIKSELCEGRAGFAGSDPAVGDAPEHEWAAKICERIRLKTEGLASRRWTPAETYDLVLTRTLQVALPRIYQRRVLSCCRFWPPCRLAGSGPSRLSLTAFRA